MSSSSPFAVAILVIELLPVLAFGVASDRVTRGIARWPKAVQIAAPACLVLPYVILAKAYHIFAWQWLALYGLLPVTMAWLMMRAAVADREQRGNWLDIAWPMGLRGWGNLLLVDAGLYAFLGIRRLSGSGFDFHFRWSDWKTGFRELLFFAPVVIGLGIALGFIHPHANAPNFFKAALGWLGIFIFVAVPEELFFRTWVQNLLERRIGRVGALVVASILFGLSHFNKRNFGSAHFNWRYVLLAAISGIFYGRAWRENRRLAASGITHTCVDWLWYLWF